jgi:hypothetical protein
LDKLRDKFGDNQKGQDGIDDVQERAKERFDEARVKLNNAVENNDGDLFIVSVIDQEEEVDDDNKLVETQLLRPEDDG